MPNAGKENLLVDISNIQCKINDVHVWIINNYYDEKLLEKFDSKIKVVKYDRQPNSNSILLFLKMNFYLLGLNPDIIHTHDSSIINIFCFSFKNKFVTTVHSTQLFENRLYSYDKVFAISKAVKDDLIASGFRKIKKIIVINNGIEFQKITLKHKFSLDETFKLIQVGRLKVDQKGQDLSIKAISFLKKIGFSIHLDIVGKGEDQGILNDLVKELNLENDISFIGEKERDWIYANLKRYNILLQPSRIEGFGLTILESLGAKLPVIASNIDGPAEILQNEKYGFLFNNGEVEDLVNRIKEIHALYKQNKIEEFVDESYSFATKNFSIHDTVTKYQKHYSEN